MKKVKDGVTKAVNFAFETCGVDVFRRTSLFGSQVTFFPGTNPCVTAAELAEQLASAERQVKGGTAILDTTLDADMVTEGHGG